MNQQSNNSGQSGVNNGKNGGLPTWQWALIFLGGALALTRIFDIGADLQPRLEAGIQQSAVSQGQDGPDLNESVLPSEGVLLPVNWGDLGKKMVEVGVIDADKLESIYSSRGGLNEEDKRLLYGAANGRILINEQNSGFILNLLWAFGLANKNPVLEKGPMTDPKYGGDASRFASTGGWVLAKGSAMDHYSNYVFAALTEEQQTLVERVSKNIYRPCCGNSTYFPDCNHGMAMLGLLELMASQGADEKEMYQAALAANSYWFPDTYLAIAKYFEKRGIGWSGVDPKEVLGSAYSSAMGFNQILKEIEPQEVGGSSCGV